MNGIPAFSQREQHELSRLKQRYDLCADVLDEYFEPRLCRVFQTLQVHRPHSMRQNAPALLRALIIALWGAAIGVLLCAVLSGRQPVYSYDNVSVASRLMPEYAIRLPEPTQPRVNVNTADIRALSSLPGIGPALAERIIAARERFGDFCYPEDLLTVSGIGEKTLARLNGLICFEE